MNKKIVIAGIVMLGVYTARALLNEQKESNFSTKNTDLQMNIAKKQHQKNNLKKLETYARNVDSFQNRDVADLLHVSEKTARNYCQQLMSSGIIKKYGTTGRGVNYRYCR